MSLVDPIILSVWAEAMKRFGLEMMTPVAIAGFALWALIRYVLGLRARATAAEAKLAASEAGRVSDARTMLLEMYRVMRETEHARAARRDLDERFLPINEALLQHLAALGPIAPESR